MFDFKERIEKFVDSNTAESLRNKVIIRRGGDSRRYEEKDIIKLALFINDKLRGAVVNRFEDNTDKECIVFYKEDLIKIFEEAFYDIKKKEQEVVQDVRS